MAIILNTVSGMIYDAFNAPLTGVTVNAYDKDLRTEQLIGSAISDAKGFYIITYDSSKFAQAENKSPDIFLRVFDASGLFMGESEVYFNTPNEFVLDFKIGNTPYEGLSEYDTLVNEITPLLQSQQVTMYDLKEDDKFKDITFLAGETGEPSEKIALLPVAFTCSQKTKTPPDIFYGLFRMSFPAKLDDLLMVKSESLLKGLKAAIRENIISSKWEPQLEKIIRDLNSLSANFVLTASDQSNTNFKKILGSTIPSDLQQTFINVLFENEASPEKFWDTLANQNGFTDGKIISETQTILNIHHLTGYDPALTQLLYSETANDPDLKELRGFAKFSVDDWKSRISGLVASGALVNFPDGIEGSTPEEKVKNYSETLSGIFQSVYPVNVFSARLKADSLNPFGERTADLKSFFSNNPDFDLNTNRINTLFDASNLDGVGDKIALKEQLKKINRLYKLSPQYQHVSAFIGLGLGSATEIVHKYSLNELTEKLIPANISTAEAKVIYKKAVEMDNKSTALALAYKMRHNVPIYAINGNNPVPSDYESMFGDNNLCDCAECQSVVSPAAYLVDLLNFLKKNNDFAYGKLIERRPDLIEILLTCENTNTPLPYIDLVNELLESLVVNQTTVAYQTKSTAPELSAYPQNLLATAYDKLIASSSGYRLPLDLSLETSRRLLEKLDFKRQAILELFFANGTNTIFTDAEIAREILGISAGDVQILNGTIPIDGITGDSPMSTVLLESQLSYIDLLQVLESYFVNPLKPDLSRSLQIVSSDQNEPATCDISKLTLSGIDRPGMLRLIRFVRLQKKLEWPAIDLDRLIQALGIDTFDLNPSDFNNKVLFPVANVKRLLDRFMITIQNAIVFFATVDTSVYLDHTRENQPEIPSFYDHLFRNKEITNPIDEAFAPKAVGLTGSITSHTPVLLSALNISPEDLSLLLSGNGGLLSPVDDQLNLQNISELYRRSSFAALLHLSNKEFLDLVTIMGFNPFQGSDHIEQLLVFIDNLDLIRNGNITLQELNYLLLNKETPLLVPSVEFIAGIFNSIRAGLKKLSNEAGSDDLISDNAVRLVAEAFVIDRLSSVFKTDHATTRVILDDTVKFAGNQSESFLHALLATSFFNSMAPLFTLDSLKNPIPALPDYFNTYYHAFKIVLLVKKLKTGRDELKFITDNSAALSIDELITNSVPVPYQAFESLLSFARLRNTWKLPLSNFLEVLSIVFKNETNAKSNFMAAISSAFSAGSSSLLFLTGDPTDNNSKGILNLSFPDDYKKGKNLLRLLASLDFIKKAGVDTEGFITAINTNNSSFLTGLLKSKYTETEWLSVIQPVSDQLRILRRDALSAYLLHDSSMSAFRLSKNLSDIDSLYTYLLIDVEMDACMFTSRIKQAISCVQLFIDRGLMNLEEEVFLGNDFAEQWNTWRKLYRVWEANRKVFLYPENWIEPELRDDKSPFFKDLESKLRQDEVSDEVVQSALLSYLEKLDAVANLEIVGLFSDELTGIVHVFGRTKSVPHQYYYRCQDNSVWSPWGKVEVDIEGDHILPVVWNNRLMLFWGIFTEKQEESSDGPVINPGVQISPPAKYFQVKIAWSEYINSKWGNKKLSKEFISTPVNTIINQFQLTSSITDGKLMIKLFAWWSSFFDNLGLGVFIFDSCNNAPYVKIVGLHNPLNQTFYSIPDVSSNLMFLKENFNSDQKFQLFDSGLYHLYSAPPAKDIFLNTPAKANLLPNHHEIEKDKPIKFFYTNQTNNFFVNSITRTRPFLTPDVLVNSRDLSFSRAEVIPQKKVFKTGIKLNMSESLALARIPAENISTDNLMTLKGIKSPFNIFWLKKYLFQSFYHPYVCNYIKTLNSEGIDALYRENIQETADSVLFDSNQYNPTSLVMLPYPLEKLEFDFTGIYSVYNWELFYHIPLLVATRLSQNQKFEEARKWFHYIYDPTKSSGDPNEGVERFWITKPFKQEAHNDILSVGELFDETHNPDLQTQLDYWAKNPFNPHAVARLRISAYMRVVVRKYIDNLIAWGDNLFKKDTIESINEATLLYVLAGNILGKRPEKVPARAIAVEQSFSNIMGNLDKFSNAKVEVQSFISPSANGESTSDQSVMMPMFCIPKNDELFRYWDIINDRLFKIRHCKNIEGIFRQLPLFEPPIDPGLLVKAASLGLDLTSIMNDNTPSLPTYRFQFMLQKALDLCADVRSLGSVLLGVLEKKDAEQLALIRSGQEVILMEAIRDIKSGQLDEAKESLKALEAFRVMVEQKRDYYSSRPYKNPSEDLYFSTTNRASQLQQIIALNNTLASFIYLIPTFKIGGPFTMGTEGGGFSFGNAAKTGIEASTSAANLLRLYGEMANVKGTYDRRQDDWTYQVQSAGQELKQVEKQIAAAEIRMAIAQKDLENHDLQIDHSKTVNDFLHSKFTNADLYDYMTGQISAIYFQSYQLAYTYAKKAEMCLQQELGIENTTFIQFGYWDSLKKGLMSGEKLQFDLRRLENAYLELNTREFEITKHLSLATINANAILDLRRTGICNFQLPELIFEIDFPSHYFRRIKSLAFSIPCIAGPYASVSSQLTLNKSFIRTKGENGEVVFDFANPAANYKPANSPVKVIATSNAQNDTGMFEFSFRDERYLPFEGAGVISDWTLELPSESRQFDYNSISDIILTIRYTSLDAVDPVFKNAVNTKIRESIAASVDLLNNHGGLYKILSMKNDIPDSFHKMKSGSSSSQEQIKLKIDKSFFPYFTNNYSLVYKGCSFYNNDGSPVAIPISSGNTASETIDNNWEFLVNYTPSDIKFLDDLYFVINYSLE